MTNKWRWILLVWHDWRAAVWWAEMKLYPREFYSGGIERIPHKHEHAKAMQEYHSDRAKQLVDTLFPRRFEGND